MNKPTNYFGHSGMINAKISAVIISVFFVSSCTPTVQVAMPDKPITINLNVKIKHEIKVKVEKELDDAFSEDSELF